MGETWVIWYDYQAAPGSRYTLERNPSPEPALLDKADGKGSALLVTNRGEFARAAFHCTYEGQRDQMPSCEGA